MKRIVGFSVPVLLFIAVNWHLGHYLGPQFKEYRDRTAPISMTILRTDPPIFAGASDIDHDAEDEVFYSNVQHVPNEQQISAFEPFETTYNFDFYGEILVPTSYVLFEVYFHRDLKTYVFKFLVLEKGRFYTRETDNRLNPIKNTPFEDLDRKLGEKSSFIGPFFVDLHQDGKNELVVILESADGISPRGVVCFDPQSRKLLWEYDSGTGIIDAEFTDIDNDRKKEIILSTYAANKAVDVNGTRDSDSYVIVLDSNGNLRWKREMGIQYTYTHSIAADIDNNGVCEIIGSTSLHPSAPQRGGKIVLFNAKGHILAQLPPQTFSYSKPLAAEYNKNRPAVYVANSEGVIQVFDPDFREIDRAKVGAPAKVLNPSAGDKEWRFVYIFAQDHLMAYDKALDEKVFDVEFQGPIPANPNPGISIIVPLRTKHGRFALVKSDNLYLLSEANPLNPGEKFHLLIKSGLLLTLVALFLFNGFWIYLLFCVKTFSKRISKEKNGADISRFLEIVRGIAHQVKNPLSTILWTAEKIKRNLGTPKTVEPQKAHQSPEAKENTGTYIQLSEFLMEDVNTLKLHTNHILKLIQIYKPSFKEVNLKTIFMHLSDHYRSLIPGNIDFRLEMEEDIIFFFDEELIKEALVNLIDNAVDAMPEGGQLRISAVQVVSPVKGCPACVLMEIEDTGTGMDEDQLAKLFTPFFTNKENGTGIGLTICKRIVEAHGGTIKVHSRKNFGTKIAITIPANPGGIR